MTNTITTGQMEWVVSADGTAIAYRRSGAGSPLVLVHGTTADHTRWAPVLPALEAHYTVYAVDRRGRGASGDGRDYAIEREFEDIVAVVDAIGTPCDLLGHSYGALCALEAALRSDRVRRLLLYEPPIEAAAGLFPRAVVRRIETLIEAGDGDGALVAFFRGIVRMPERDIALLRAPPTRAARVAAVHTIPREMRAAERYHFDPARFGRITTPTLLLLGGESPQPFRDGTATLNASVPASRIAVLAGQQHAAISTAPDLFAREVLRFLGDDEHGIG